MAFQRELQQVQAWCKRPSFAFQWPLMVTGGILLSGAAWLSGAALWQSRSADAEPASPASTPASTQWVPLQNGLGDGLGYSASLIRQAAPRLTAQAQAPEPVIPAAEAGGEAAIAEPPEPLAAGASVVIDDALEMRVAIARRISTLDVGTSTQGWLIDASGQQRCDIPAQSSLLATPTGQGLNFSGCELSTAVWLEASAGGYLYIGDSWYKGRVLLLNDGGELIAVNFVLLRDYLSSVVGSEMYHHWPLEALKAQAVAARSYALTHHVRPASDHFDLDNTQRYQAYKGVALETTNTQIAVAATAGEFISYQGGIVESLYAASDQIVQEAHGGQGMSQTGAKDYAVQGYSYEQILGAYYPSTTLSRLVVQ
ncbi:MAG: SpoIID/LytB domain-containing protein [Leptolyngbya sp. RL_3_1]|nr:SpoIID/LytB domain-containing protein [Leptolyngbya sp. RL_3_1]